MQFKIPSFLQTLVFDKKAGLKTKKTAAAGYIFILGSEDRARVKSLIKTHAPKWQAAGILEQFNREVIHFAGVRGPVWIFCKNRGKSLRSHYGRLDDSEYSWHRDQAGSILAYAKAYRVKSLHFELRETTVEQELGVYTGLEISSYSFKNVLDQVGIKEFPKTHFVKVGGKLETSILREAQALAEGTNVARHLVNMPPNYLNPKTLSDYVAKEFAKTKDWKIEIWNQARLKKENMGLHLGVGQGSSTPPAMLHLRYRPAAGNKNKPIAFVGKGITFDTGGLDLKPSSNMRLMKKDMGGAAALVGLAIWAKHNKPAVAMDFYLALAENSVDRLSMRPSDVLTARNGMRVEIHNTDAEGRLVLADVLDVAVTQKGANEPRMVIDVATLTGAIKAGLGAEISGLFSNQDELAENLNISGARMGEPSWRMPLYTRYTKGMDTPFADIVNAVDGFGGAITAALFLEKFVRNKPWAHLDIYAWNDKATGALTFAGGSGQPVQTLAQFIKGMSTV